MNKQQRPVYFSYTGKIVSTQKRNKIEKEILRAGEKKEDWPPTSCIMKIQPLEVMWPKREEEDRPESMWLGSASKREIIWILTPTQIPPKSNIISHNYQAKRNLTGKFDIEFT